MESTIRFCEAAEKLGISRQMLHRLVREGKIPKPVRVNNNTAYYEKDVLNAAVLDIRAKAVEKAKNLYGLV